MNKKKMLTAMALTAALLAAVFAAPKILSFLAGKIMAAALGGTMATLYGDVPQGKRMLLSFGRAIGHEISYGTKEGETSVQDYLDAGCDPNCCLLWLEGWKHENPLMLFNTYSMYHTYNVEHPAYPDIDVFNKLVKAGADIHKYPYVWTTVFCHDNYNINDSKSRYEMDEISQEDMEKQIESYITDSNRVLKLFLDAGADVNRKGSPVPFDYEKGKKMTEEEVQRHFNSPEATTPLYEAIKKGMLWESQVDLLLEYGAILDESCMEAARRSGDDAMVEKLERLMRP